MLCIFYVAAFGVLGIFSASHRKLFFESLECVKSTFTHQPCETQVDQKIKVSVTHKIFKRSPWLAKYFNQYFRAISWILIVLTLVTGILTAKVGYDLLVYGTCTPSDPSGCSISQVDKLVASLKGVVR